MATVATTSPPSAFRKTTETFTTGARTLPQRYFISPEVFAEEQRKIFAREWICVGHQSQIARAGDYFVREVAGESLIIVRGKGGHTRAFYNVAVIAEPVCARRRADMARRFNVPIMPGPMGLMGA